MKNFNQSFFFNNVANKRIVKIEQPNKNYA